MLSDTLQVTGSGASLTAHTAWGALRGQRVNNQTTYGIRIKTNKQTNKTKKEKTNKKKNSKQEKKKTHRDTHGKVLQYMYRKHNFFSNSRK